MECKMNKNSDFEKLQRKVFLAYQQDGILDLLVGINATGFAIFMLTDSVIFMSIGAMSAILYILLKQRITIPRFGYVDFGRDRTVSRRLTILVGIGVLVFITFLAGAILPRMNPSLATKALLDQYHMVIISGMVFGLPCAIVALLLGLRRFYLYALLAVGLPALGGFFGTETYLPMLTLGLLVTATGIWLLAKFTQRYPLDEEAGSGVRG
jgi:hypothetical protein